MRESLIATGNEPPAFTCIPGKRATRHAADHAQWSLGLGRLEGEPEPAVRAVLGHWLFGYVHPYPDGNRRITRFLMNLFLASGGYSWTIIKVEHRATYLSTLDTASIDHDAGPFARFIAEQAKAA